MANQTQDPPDRHSTHLDAQRLARINRNEAYHRALLGYRLQTIDEKKIYKDYGYDNLTSYCNAELASRHADDEHSYDYYRRLIGFAGQDLESLRDAHITFDAQLLLKRMMEERPQALQVFYQATRRAKIHGERQTKACNLALWLPSDEDAAAALRKSLFGPDVSKAPEVPVKEPKTRSRKKLPTEVGAAGDQLNQAIDNMHLTRQRFRDLAELQGLPEADARELHKQTLLLMQLTLPLLAFLGDRIGITAAPLDLLRGNRRETERDPAEEQEPEQEIEEEAVAMAEEAEPALEAELEPGAEPEPEMEAAAAEEAETEEEAEPEPVYVPPRRPFADPEGEAILEVHAHPSTILDLTRAERLSYRIFSLAGALTPVLSEWLHRRTIDHEDSFEDLQLLARNQLEDVYEGLGMLMAALAEPVAQAQVREIEDADEPTDVVLDYILHDVCDPLSEPDSTDMDKLLWKALGLLPLLVEALVDLIQLRNKGGDEAAIDFRLARRFGELFAPFKMLVAKTSGIMSSVAQRAYLAQQADAELQAQVEAVRGPRSARIIMVGADFIPEAHGIFAKTDDDRLVSWSFWEPSLSLFLADRGKGKSHLCRVLIENMTLRPDNLAYLPRSQCPILIESDNTTGQGRFEMVEGFFPNRDVDQLAQLHKFYQAQGRNHAFKRAFLLVHQDQVEPLKQILAPYVERGLIIMPLKLGVCDLGGFAFEAMLQWAVGGDQHAVYKNLIAQLVAKHGERLTLGKLRQAIEASSLRGTSKQTVMELLNLMGQFYSEGESVMQYVGDYPVFTVIRSRFLPSNFVNPLLAVIFNAFCRSTAHGDPARLVIFEELAKILAGNPLMLRFLMNFAAELRHRPVSAIGCLQNLTRDIRGLWGAASNHMVFGLSNPADWKLAQAEHYGMRSHHFREVEAHAMKEGRALAFARQSNSVDLQRGLLIDVRPTLIRAGGKTWNAGDGIEE